MRRWRHPSRPELAVWLEGGAADLDEHLATCDRCARIIEEMESGEQPMLASALAAVFEPPEGYADRLADHVAERAESQVLFQLATDLFGAGLETTLLLATDENDSED